MPSPQAAEFLFDADAEHPKLSHLVDDLVRDQRVFEVPAMSMGRNTLTREIAELLADHVHGVVIERLVRDIARTQPRCHRQSGFSFVPVLQEDLHRIIGGEHLGCLADTQFARTCELVLTHRHAAEQLSEILAKGNAQHQFLKLAIAASGHAPLGPVDGNGQGFGRGCDPGKAVNETLLAIDRLAVRFAGRGDRSGNAIARCIRVGLRRIRGPLSCGDPIGHRYSTFAVMAVAPSQRMAPHFVCISIGSQPDGLPQEQRRLRPERKARQITLLARQTGQLRGGERSMDHKRGIALFPGGIGKIVMNPVTVERHRRKAEEVDGIGLPLPSFRCRRAGDRHGRRRTSVAVYVTLPLANAHGAFLRQHSIHFNEHQVATFAALVSDLGDRADLFGITAQHQWRFEANIGSREHATGQGDRRQKATALGMTVDTDLGITRLRQEKCPVRQRRQIAPHVQRRSHR